MDSAPNSSVTVVIIPHDQTPVNTLRYNVQSQVETHYYIITVLYLLWYNSASHDLSVSYTESDPLECDPPLLKKACVWCHIVSINEPNIGHL